MLPFFDVQLTWLARWNEEPINIPVDVSNETILSNNQHSRGMAKVSAGVDDTKVESAIHMSNLGFTATDSIDPSYGFDLRYANLFILANGAEPPPGVSDIVVRGQITSAVPGVKAADVEISAIGAQCDRTNEGYECVLETGGEERSLTVSNYIKQNKVLVACSNVLTVAASNPAPNPWTRFYLPFANTSNANIVIRENSCG